MSANDGERSNSRDRTADRTETTRRLKPEADRHQQQRDGDDGAEHSRRRRIGLDEEAQLGKAEQIEDHIVDVQVHRRDVRRVGRDMAQAVAGRAVMKAKKVLLTERLEEKVGMAIGFRNTWASAIKKLLDEIEGDKYKEWKKKYQ